MLHRDNGIKSACDIGTIGSASNIVKKRDLWKVKVKLDFRG